MRDAIRVDGVSKRFARYARRRHFSTLKSALLRGDLFRSLTPQESVAALEDVNFTVASGSMVAVIGPNGSGKSTLLKILAGILRPTTGTVTVAGRVAALLELGAGFHPEISGRENIIINGIMLGLARKEIERRMGDIIHFAELEDFIDAPVKTYSSGMYVRLGFSVAVAVEPDVLIVDEVLAVGDEAFSHKCLDRFRDLKRRQRTVLLVTHSLDLAEQMADEIILIDKGRVVVKGDPRAVIDQYRGNVAQLEAQKAAAGELRRDATSDVTPGSAATPEATREETPVDTLIDAWRPRRWGNGAIELNAIRLLDRHGSPASLFQTGDPMTIEFKVEVHIPQTDFVFGVAVWARDGTLVYGTNTHIERFRPQSLMTGGQVSFAITALWLLEGSYSLDVAVHSRDGVAYDYSRAALSFAVRSAVKDTGVVRLAHEWSFDGGVMVAPDDGG